MPLIYTNCTVVDAKLPDDLLVAFVLRSNSKHHPVLAGYNIRRARDTETSFITALKYVLLTESLFRRTKSTHLR